MKIAGFLNSFMIICVVFLIKGALSTEAHYDLFELLFSNYKTHIRPVYDKDTSTNVTMKLFLSQVIHLDERMQTLKSNSWITLIWTDEYLRWFPGNFTGIRNLKVPTSKVWMPDITLYNNAGNYYNFMQDHVVIVTANGTVTWASPIIFTTYCKINVNAFPFDKQTCSLKFGPWQHDKSEVGIQGEGGDISVFSSDGQWDMINITFRNKEEEYPDDLGKKFTDVEYEVVLRRRPLYYLFNLVTPCFLVSIVAMMTFFLPPESGEKISLCITVLLSMTVFLLMVAETMPPTSSVPIIGQYFAATMALISLSLAMSTCVLNIHHRSSDTHPVPDWMRKIILCKLARFIMPSCKADDEGSRVGTRLANEFQTWEIVDQTTVSPMIEQRQVTGNCQPSNQHFQRLKAQEDLLWKMKGEIRKIVTHYEGEAVARKVGNDWIKVARVLDRVFLFLYIIGSALTIGGVVCQLKNE
ncbi:neuronal acetylcholine receptor subunit alpha-3-like [Anneissia japonica]|uniref:neuronal acetylcholine receptor subunit alpha-3-like n=1 Tax=Anneissia japonica TaxID=1529436 RepID=UPI00142569E0|nr:neuronal acetylcholine receptor subunit alpha-3-like [Anneissia japonica]